MIRTNTKIIYFNDISEHLSISKVVLDFKDKRQKGHKWSAYTYIKLAHRWKGIGIDYDLSSEKKALKIAEDRLVKFYIS